MNLRNVEAMHAMEVEVLRLTRKLRDIEQVLKIEEVAPDASRPCVGCGDWQTAKGKHRRQLDALARQQDKLAKDLLDERASSSSTKAYCTSVVV
ncbi:hypothetical protein H257_13376 [Aphanomyces astaci]|uniref:Uncharacterized protein n=1 Tax=Aphanomyces astaci TaxID=112090 RepID=W4FWC0_APHAT|nr:hypothetical protein H257_13376 [Aphanomyces astaci]ETV71236.1 hypothetical protein H257_13376 [Aphanomyces astaci]|eukprot:XP_009839176.1 hypothetical protein H257_13376 [Aphanomyces astaci]